MSAAAAATPRENTAAEPGVVPDSADLAGQEQRGSSPRGTGSRAQPSQARGPSGSRRRPRDDVQIIDLTASPPDLELEIVTSTVTRAPPARQPAKRPRVAPSKTVAEAAPPPQEPPSPVARGPKCGICLETMGSEGRNMMAGPCGHVYCKDCLLLAVKVNKKCPTCRKSIHPRQLHNVFIDF